MISKLWKKFVNLKLIEKISVFLWFFCLILIFAFVILAVVIDSSDKTLYANVLASVGFIFLIVLFSSLFTTIWPQTRKKKNE